MVFVLCEIDTAVDAEAKLVGSCHSRVYRRDRSAATELAGWQWVKSEFPPTNDRYLQEYPAGAMIVP
jgi:hypothetical protein